MQQGPWTTFGSTEAKKKLNQTRELQWEIRTSDIVEGCNH